jgi:hypothetical protein
MASYSTPLGKFEQQRRQAKQRGIEWLLSFDEWFKVWQDSGMWLLRGKRAGQYVMARKGDVGPYSTANVYICLASENHSHAHANGRVPIRPRRVVVRRHRPEPRGWTYVARSKRRPYQVMFRDQYVGAFATQQEAEEAYRNARAIHMRSVCAVPTIPFFVPR